MRHTIKRLSVCSMLTAVSVVILYLASVIPSGRLALCAVSAILPALVILLYDVKWAVLVYTAVSFIALVLLPSRTVSLVYALILGHYTITKSLIERRASTLTGWILKLVVFNAGVLAIYLLYTYLFLSDLPYAVWVFFALGSVVFVVYDIVLSRFINEFLLKIAERLR